MGMESLYEKGRGKQEDVESSVVTQEVLAGGLCQV